MASKIRPDLFGASKDLPRIVELDVAKINPNPNQPRKFFDETSLRELAESIKSKGLLQPILVKVGQGDSYEIVAGERRWRAHKLAEIATIPATAPRNVSPRYIHYLSLPNCQSPARPS